LAYGSGDTLGITLEERGGARVTSSDFTSRLSVCGET
jgi:hypothetical protein